MRATSAPVRIYELQI